MIYETKRNWIIGAALAIATIAVAPAMLRAHCDSLDGPVVTAAKKALEGGEITPVLMWVHAEDEAEIRAAFGKALAARANGAEAREVADTWFFETLVRVHRAGEGAPYTGLKAAGSAEEGIKMADEALATGSAAQLLEEMRHHVAAGIHERFLEVVEARKNADKSVEAGRHFVKAYVEFIHYVENLRAALTQAGHADAGHHD